MAFATDPVQDIKERLPVESLIGEYLVLKRAGINLKGLCPFHQEKTPSFMVSPERRSWHCFGCSKGGDIFSFIMEIEGLEFREALQLLARKAGVELPERQFDRKKAGRAARLVEVNTVAMAFFEQALLADADPQGKQSSAAAAARDELTRRKVDQLTRETFHVGFAPSGTDAAGPDASGRNQSGRGSWSALTDYLRKKGFTDSEMVAAGVAVARPAPRQGVYDRFRNRLTFPLIDVVGRTVGFSARALDPEEKMGKYINSPESEVYHKGKFLFALNAAKSEIRRRNFVVLVEGQMDAVSSHRVGVRNVVATSGTALTTDQLALLKRYTTNLILAFDVDAAGSNATKRGIDLAIVQGFNVKVARMPEGVDPDDLCRDNPKAWAEALNHSEAIVEHYIRKATAGKDLSVVEVKKAVARVVLPEIARLTDVVEQTHYLQRVAGLLGVEESVLRTAIERTPKQSGGQKTESNASESEPQKPRPVDSLLRKVARLIALKLRGVVISPEDIAPLRVLDAAWVTRVHELLLAEQAEQPLFEQLGTISPDLARLVDHETFALDQELEHSEETPGKELSGLVREIVRQGLRRELAELHKASAQSGSAEQFVKKTQALAKLEEQA
ncbi:MAG: DNA primase [Candidatus Andersenbacteria bacterium]